MSLNFEHWNNLEINEINIFYDHSETDDIVMGNLSI